MNINEIFREHFRVRAVRLENAASVKLRNVTNLIHLCRN